VLPRLPGLPASPESRTSSHAHHEADPGWVETPRHTDQLVRRYGTASTAVSSSDGQPLQPLSAQHWQGFIGATSPRQEWRWPLSPL
jgi:hypothetical protein